MHGAQTISGKILDKVSNMGNFPQEFVERLSIVMVYFTVNEV